MVSIICIYLISRDWKKRFLQVCICMFTFTVLFVVVELCIPKVRVIKATMHYRPHVDVKFTFHDKPRVQRTYPNVSQESSVAVHFSTDAQGFRNAKVPKKVDIVVVGDSFTEGIWVDNDDVWPYLLAKKTGKTVYNLGISGAHPSHYYENLKKYGIPLQPKIVICMLYELNDFKISKHVVPKRPISRLKHRVLRSQALKFTSMLLEKSFGGIYAQDTFANQQLFSWLPVEISQPKPHRYAFYLNAFRWMSLSPQEFRSSAGWKDTQQKLQDIINLCRRNNINIIFAFAPSKGRVVFPFVKDQIPNEKLWQLLSSRKKNLPPDILSTIANNIDTVENSVHSFCKEQKVDFCSLLNGLRDHTIQQGKMYYTYDVHWSPQGHEVVSNILVKYMEKVKVD